MNKTKSNATLPLQRRSFLITCWQERDELVGSVVWRFLLETTAEGDKRLFTDLQDLCAEIAGDLCKHTQQEDE